MTRAQAASVDASDLPPLPPDWRYEPVSALGQPDEQAVLTGPFGTNLGRGDFVERGVPVLTIGCLTEGGINLDKALYVSEEKARELERYQLREGDLLFSRMASVGRAGIVPKSLAGALFNYHIMRLRLDESRIDPRVFINYVRGAKQVRDYLKAVNHGATRDGINTEQLLGLPVAVPPPAEQREMVAEIEKQFSRLDEAVANLKRVKANLRNLWASALNTACEGPWPSIEFGLLARETLVGLDRGRDQQRSVGPGHRYVKMNNVSMDGEIQPEGIVYVDASSQEATRYALRSGDILLNTRNSVELVGKSALVPPALEGALYNNNLMRIRTTPEIDPAFLAMQMCAPAFRRQLEKVKRATTSVAAIYLKDLVRVPVIVPPVTEQCRIVAEVERRLSIIREVAAEADRNSQRAQALRQAVLRRTFAGEPEVRIAV